MHEDRIALNNLTERIIGCAYTVSNKLGCGFLEKVYENALQIELSKEGIPARQQHPMNVRYDEQIGGEFFADILVQDAILLELKAVSRLNGSHVAQCINYLKASGLTLCLLMNFANPRLEIKRIING